MSLAGLPVLHSLGSATMIQTTTDDYDWTLPSKDYRDPALFERERREIFAKNWMLFSWSGRLREPGDYVTGAVAGYPVFAMRDDEGRVRAFHNVCRHRGAQLLSEPSGHCGKLLVCPYHSWSYTRVGHLNKAVDFGRTRPSIRAPGASTPWTLKNGECLSSSELGEADRG